MESCNWFRLVGSDKNPSNYILLSKVYFSHQGKGNVSYGSSCGFMQALWGRFEIGLGISRGTTVATRHCPAHATASSYASTSAMLGQNQDSRTASSLTSLIAHVVLPYVMVAKGELKTDARTATQRLPIKRFVVCYQVKIETTFLLLPAGKLVARTKSQSHYMQLTASDCENLLALRLALFSQSGSKCMKYHCIVMHGGMASQPTHSGAFILA